MHAYHGPPAIYLEEPGAVFASQQPSDFFTLNHFTRIDGCSEPRTSDHLAVLVEDGYLFGCGWWKIAEPLINGLFTVCSSQYAHKLSGANGHSHCDDQVLGARGHW